MEAGEKVRPRKRQACDRLLWTSFQVPDDLRGRPAWLTYDACHLAESDVRELMVNGKPVRIGLPDPAEDGIRPQGPQPTDPTIKGDLVWFADIAPLLEYGRENRVAIRIGKWPVPTNMGVWLYSPPAQEKVLFLEPAKLEPRVQALVAAYVGEVQKRFPVVSVRRRLSFDSPAALRAFLRKIATEERISGVVFIGNHPVPTISSEDEPKAWPRFYEALDLAEQDAMEPSREHRDMRVWTAWIRSVPGEAESLKLVLEKALAYYRGELCFPDCGLIAPDPAGNPFAVPHTGQTHFDLLSRAADLTYYNAHGGTSHGGKGPHNTVAPSESQSIWPSGLIVKLYGCSAGNIAREKITPGESFLMGRPVTQAVITHTKPQGGAYKCVPRYGYRDLLRISPHAGIMYQYFYDMRGGYPYSLILLGNPFVRVGSGLSAPSGAIEGKLTELNGVRPEGVYISIWRNEQSFGRTRVAPNGDFSLRFLPQGTYQAKLHINAVENLPRTIQVKAGSSTTIQWALPPCRTVAGTVRAENGDRVPDAWVEVASEARPQAFGDNDVFGILTTQEGDFSLIATSNTPLFLRACVGKRLRSAPMKVSIPTEGVKGVLLKLRMPVVPDKDDEPDPARDE